MRTAYTWNFYHIVFSTTHWPNLFPPDFEQHSYSFRRRRIELGAHEVFN
jgi:hypothetical protein